MAVLGILAERKLLSFSVSVVLGSLLTEALGYRDWNGKNGCFVLAMLPTLQWFTDGLRHPSTVAVLLGFCSRMATVMEGFSPKPGTVNASGLFETWIARGRR